LTKNEQVPKLRMNVATVNVLGLNNEQASKQTNNQTDRIKTFTVDY